MSYRVEINKKAAKAIERLPKKDIERIVQKISGLRENPYPAGSKKLVGTEEPLYRVRQGNYRIIYLVEEQIKVVEVRTVSHRKDAYT